MIAVSVVILMIVLPAVLVLIGLGWLRLGWRFLRFLTGA